MMADDPTRCLRGEACADVTELRDENDAWIANVGALLGPRDACGLCRVCNLRARHATRYLLLDWMDMGVLMKPSGAIRFREPDMPAVKRVKLNSPMPLNGDPLAWQELAHHEATHIATSVAYARHDTPPLGGTTRHAQFAHAITYIHQQWDTLLTLDPVSHPARSESFDELDGHNLDAAFWADDDVWIVRGGPLMASRLFDLHLSAEQKTGVAVVDVLPVPCPACTRRNTLVRDHRANSVYCRNRHCRHFMSDDVYDDLRGMTPESFRAFSASLAAEDAA
jgi:hypothetical protein